MEEIQVQTINVQGIDPENNEIVTNEEVHDSPSESNNVAQNVDSDSVSNPPPNNQPGQEIQRIPLVRYQLVLGLWK